MKTVFLRALEAGDKAAALLMAIRVPEATQGKQRFEVDPVSFASVPGSPFAYWVSERLRRLFTELPAFETEGRTAKQGLATADDFRFVRAWWEAPPGAMRERWFPFAKGGKFSPFYADLHLVLDWCGSGAALKAKVIAEYGNAGKRIYNEEYYFRPGLTWPLRGIRFSAQAVPPGCVFSIAGKMAFVRDDAPTAWLALFNAQPFDRFIAFFAGKVGGVQYEVGLIQRIPVPHLTPANQVALAALARRGWSLRRLLDTRSETSHAFTLPALLRVEGEAFSERCPAWAERVRAAEAEIGAIRAEIDARCFDLYGIDAAERRAITAGFSSAGDSTDDGTDVDADSGTEEAPDEPGDAATDTASLAAELVSWAVGVAFGRFDVRLAIGARALPAEPEPFDVLPVSSPAMLTGDEGLPLPSAPRGYPLTLPEGGVLVDQPGHPLDIDSGVRQVLQIIWKDRFDDIEREACELLGVKSLRDYFRKPSGFFADHLKRYSKSRRQAPIYWPLSTASGSYTVWVYYHRLTDQTLYTCVNNFVQPKLNDLEKDIPRLRDEKHAKELRAAVELQGELEDFKQNLLTWAPIWKPNLNDGVLITACPLWKVFRLPKWCKELEACWKELEAGDYEWAHLAYTLWTDRVREKCKRDRSIAIAHGLEEICDVEGPKAKKGKKGGRTKNEDAVQMGLDENGDSEEADA